MVGRREGGLRLPGYPVSFRRGGSPFLPRAEAAGRGRSPALRRHSLDCGEF